MVAALKAGDPRRIGPYSLAGRLGEGGMGVVYHGKTAAGRDVAVKVILPRLAGKPEFRRRFTREVAAARQVRSRFTATVMDADTTGTTPWIATEYVPGPSLAQLVRQTGPLNVVQVLALSVALCEALRDIHAAGMVHRDLKPTNVILSDNGPRVIDFGLAAIAGAADAGTAGTPGYTPPEALSGDSLSPASDIFSLGAVLAYAAAGRSPFGSEPETASEPDLAGVPAELRGSVAACLAPRPADRPPLTEVMLSAVEAAWTRFGIGPGLLENLSNAIPSVRGWVPDRDDNIRDPWTLSVAVERHSDGFRHTVDGPASMATSVEPDFELRGSDFIARTEASEPRQPVPAPGSFGGLPGAGSGLAAPGNSGRTPTIPPTIPPGGWGAAGNGEPPAWRGTPEENPGDGQERPRFLTGELPERAPALQRVSLHVQVTLAPQGGRAAGMKPFAVPPAGRTLTITVSAPGLLPLGDLEQELHVPFAEDSEPIRFGFRTAAAGLHTVKVRAFSEGTFLGALELQMSVEVGAALEEGAVRAARLPGTAAEPGEVTLQVSRTDEDRYVFQLIGRAFYPVEITRRLAGDPTRIVAAIVDELRAMSAHASPFSDPDLVRHRIRSLGSSLWADVVPEAIQQQFWAQADRIKQFTILSDMDIVPWELLYPVNGANDNGFLVEQFPVVRRVYGQEPRDFALTSAAYVVPPRSPSNALDEVRSVRGLLPEGIDDWGVLGDLRALNRLLEERTPSLLHFACHNTFSEQDGSVISLDGGPLRPSDLAFAVQKTALAQASPLVFLNACRTAGEIHGLMKTIGWAKQFMGAGAGAFVGTLWAVESGVAQKFAEAFYGALVTDRLPLGEASLRARQAVAERPGDPTWLAYTVYGNPVATVRSVPGFRVDDDDWL